MKHKQFIALDWGTTSFRAYLVGADGEVRDQVSAAEGILAVKDGGFEGVLEGHIGGWDKALPVVATGMITSRQGWVELPYADCPAGPQDLAKLLHFIFSVRSLALFGDMQATQLASYLSGIVIGTEVAHATLSNGRSARYAILASAAIGGRYMRAMQHSGLDVVMGNPLAIVKGEAIVAHMAGVIR